MGINTQCLADTFAAIDAAKGAKGKQAMIAEVLNGADPALADLFKKILVYAYDDSIRFGLTDNQIEIPLTASPHADDFGPHVFDILDQVRVESKLTEKKRLIEGLMVSMEADANGYARTLIKHIIAKDLRVGIGASTINKAIPGLLSEFSVMLAKPFEPRHVGNWPVLVEPKLDGLRAIAEVDCAAGTVRFLTRSGKDIDSLEDYKRETLRFAHQFSTKGVVVFDGEVTSGSFLESMSSVRSKSKQAEDATFHVFDVLVGTVLAPPLGQDNDKLKEQGTQTERRAKLQAAFEKFRASESPKFIAPTAVYKVSSVEEVYQLYNAHRDANLEGVIVKDPHAHYVKKRSPSWLKIKAEETEDLPIVGYYEGQGQFAGSLGGLIVEREGVNTEVGSGFTPAQRAEYWEALQGDQERINRGAQSQLLGILAEIQFQEVLPSGKLRHPVFVRLRKDKSMGVGSF